MKKTKKVENEERIPMEVKAIMEQGKSMYKIDVDAILGASKGSLDEVGETAVVEEEVPELEKQNNSEYLALGSKIEYKKGKDSITYTVVGIAGEGAFSKTYYVSSPGHRAIEVMKEFFPESARREGNKVHYNDTEYAIGEAQEAFKKEPTRILSIMYPELEKQGISIDQAMLKVTDEQVKEWDKFNLAIPRIDAFYTNGTWYYVMEKVEGLTLMQYMKLLNDEKQQMPLELGLELIKQLCVGIQYMHEANCIHQDIAPQNIIFNITENETVNLKVIDYGLATTIDNKDKRFKTHVKKLGSTGFVNFNELDSYELRDDQEKKKIDVYAIASMMVYLCVIRNSDGSTKADYELVLKADDVAKGELEWPISLNEVKDNPNLAVDAVKLRMLCEIVKMGRNLNLDERIPSVDILQNMTEFVQCIGAQVKDDVRNSLSGKLKQTAFGERFLEVYEKEGLPVLEKADPVVVDTEPGWKEQLKKYGVVAVLALVLAGGGFWWYAQTGNNIPNVAVQPHQTEKQQMQDLPKLLTEEIHQAMHIPELMDPFLQKVADDAELILRKDSGFESVLNISVKDLFSKANHDYHIGETHRVVEVTTENGLITEIYIVAN